MTTQRTTPARVVITGASGDIGSAVVDACLAAGSQVVAQVHSRPGSWRHGEDNSECDVTEVRADLCADDGVRMLSASLPDGWEGVDLLVNCVGGARPVPLGELPLATWRACMQLNAEVPFTVLKALVGHLERAKGAVVNISSVVAFTGGAFGPHYAAAKAAVIGLTRSAAHELGPRGIRVNCVAPGPVESAMTASLNSDVIARLMDATPLRRVVRPAEVADAVLWLASATGVTGQTLVVDGGRVLR